MNYFYFNILKNSQGCSRKPDSHQGLRIAFSKSFLWFYFIFLGGCVVVVVVLCFTSYLCELKWQMRLKTPVKFPIYQQRKKFLPSFRIPLSCTTWYPKSLSDFTFSLATSLSTGQKLIGFCSFMNLSITMGGSFVGLKTNQRASSLLPSWNYFPAWDGINSHHSCWELDKWPLELNPGIPSCCRIGRNTSSLSIRRKKCRTQFPTRFQKGKEGKATTFSSATVQG